MTSAQFDAQTADRLARIQANPNPHTLAARMKKFVREFDTEAALDSVRNILAVLGAGAVLAYFSVMKLVMIVPMIGFLGLVWLLDYRRHF